MKKYRKRIILSTLIIAIVVMIVGIFTGDSSFSFNTISNSSELSPTCSPGGATTKYVNTTTLNVRNGGDTSATQIGTLSKCTEVKVYCTAGTFSRISNYAAKYVSSSYLSSSLPSDCGSKITTSVDTPTYTVGTFRPNINKFYQDSNYSGSVTLTNVRNVGSGEESKINVSIVNSSNSNVTGQFNLSKSYTYNEVGGVGQGQMVISMSKKDIVTPGTYYIQIDSHRVSFVIYKKELNFTITKTGSGDVPENQYGTWYVTLDRTITPSGYNISNFTYKITDNKGVDRSSWFNVTTETNNNRIVIKNKKREFSFTSGKWQNKSNDYAKEGTYTISIIVQNPSDFEHDKVANGTRTVNITIGPKVGILTEEKDAQEVNRYKLNIINSSYKIAVRGIRLVNNSKVYLIENVEEQDESKKYEEFYEAELRDTFPNLKLEEFEQFFDGIPTLNDQNRSTILINPQNTSSGYHFAYKGDNIFVYKKNETSFTYVTDSGELKTATLEDFQAEYPSTYSAVTDATRYATDEDGYIRYIDSGTNTRITKEIEKMEGLYPLAVSGGEYKIKLTFKDYLDDELTKFTAKLTGKDGKELVTYANGGKSVKNADFDLNVDLTHMGESTIYITIVYRSNESDYAGNYNLTYGFVKDDHSSPFTLQDGIFDYVIFSELSEEDSVDDRLECEDLGDGNYNCEQANSNKKYPYYIGFYLKKSNVDIDNIDFALEQMSYKIYDKKATLDAQGRTIFYDEEDYTLKIISKINNNITFALSTNGGSSFGTNQTLTLEQFKTQYEDAYEMLNIYTFDTSGTLTGDNLKLKIEKLIEPTGTETQRKLQYKNGASSATVIMDDNFKHTYADIYKYITINRINFNNGNYQLGVINGTRKIFEDKSRAAIVGNDVTDEFFVKVNRTSEEDDSLDPDKAIVILPKTEVDPGDYYVYVSYGGLDGVGYEYDYGTHEGEVESDAPIDKELFPEYWEQNIHETSISYGPQEYDVTVGDIKITNEVDDTLNAYSNATSHIQIPFVLDYIYDLGEFHYEIERYDQNQWVDANDDFDINIDLHIPDTINENNYKESVNRDSTIDLTTKVGTTKQGKYRIRFTYTNADNTVKMKEVIQEFNISGNYYTLKFQHAADTIFYTNLKKTIDFNIDCYSISDPENIEFSLSYEGTDQPVDKNTKTFKSFKNNNDVIFSYTTAKTDSNGNDNSVYTIKLSNYYNNGKPLAEAGKYTLTASYQSNTGVKSETTLEFEVVEPQKDINSTNITPKANDDGYSFTLNLNADFISYESLTQESTKYSVMKYDKDSRNYVDVANTDSTSKLFSTKGEWTKNNDENSSTVAGTLNVQLEKDKVSDIFAFYDEFSSDTNPYYIVITVDYEEYEIEIPDLKELFDWKITNVDISGHIDDENGDPFPVNGLYHNVDDTTITVDVSTPHEDQFKYLITQSCAKDTECNPNENTTNFNSRFTETTHTNNELVLKLNETGKNGESRLAAGDYQLVLYYNQSDYRIYDLVVHNDYVAIIFDDEISISTRLSNGRYVSELYTNKSSTIEIFVKVIGADYEDVTLSVTDPNQDNDYKEKFTFNQEKFNKEHMLDISYDAKSNISAGEYMIMASKTVDDEEVYDTQNIEFNNQYYSFDFESVEYQPNPAVPNSDDGGNIKLTVSTDALFTGDTNANSEYKKLMVDNLRVTSSTGDDVTNEFTKTYSDTSDSSKFEINLAYSNSDKLAPGEYTVSTSCVKGSTVVRRETKISFGEYEIKLNITNVETMSEATDRLVHKNINGTYKINYTSNHEVDLEKIEVKILDSSKKEIQDKFDVEKNYGYIEINYTADEEHKVEVGKYEVQITYLNKNKHNVNTVEVIMYDDYKEIKIENLQSSVEEVIAEEEGQYFTFDLINDGDNLTEEEIKKLKVRVYDEYNNIVYSTIESDEANKGFKFANGEKANQYKLTLESYGARVGDYQVVLVLVGSYDYYNESNRLDFSVDKTKYYINLNESSFVNTKERINDTDDIYDFIGVDGSFDFTTDSPIGDSYSIKILNHNKLIKELPVIATNESLISNVKFDAEDISNGEVEFALCIKGLPYASINKDVLEYIKIDDLSIILDNKDIKDDEEITLRPNDVKEFTVVVKPDNATNKNPVFTAEDSKIATFEGKTITVTGSGETTIKVYTKEKQMEFKLKVYPYIESDTYEVDNVNMTIFVNKLTSTTFTKEDFLHNLKNVTQNAQILDNKDKDVTTSTNVIGTNYKIINNNYTYTIIVIGDVTGDGRIEMGDVTYLNRIVKGRENPTDQAVLKAAHILKKEILESGDVTKLNRFYRGRINEI